MGPEVSVPEQDVMQLKVTLLDVDPPVWRRIQVPGTYTFWGLHVAIQDAMGWQDYHLHKFQLRGENKRAVVVGIPDEEYEAGRQTLPGWEVPLSRYLAKPGQKVKYEYDFGDGWEHDLILEKVLAQEGEAPYPRCIDGARACPPEDCGGAYGYARLLKALADTRHPSHEELLEWVGGAFDAEAFDPLKVEFDDPDETWQIAFAE